jgi:hypothetical protein
MMAGLKLAKLPDRTPVKITIAVPPELNQSLSQYAELYTQAYGEIELVQNLIPAMLASFLQSDRAFAVRRGRPRA